LEEINFFTLGKIGFFNYFQMGKMGISASTPMNSSSGLIQEKRKAKSENARGKRKKMKGAV